MFKSVKCLIYVVVALNLGSCSNNSNAPVIKFSADSSSIVIKNIDEASLFQVKNAYHTNPDSVNFISVLLTPNETDSLQNEEYIAGYTKLQGDSVLFVPEEPFLAGKSYLVESYIGVKFADGGKLLKGTIKHNLEPQQQVLKR